MTIHEPKPAGIACGVPPEFDSAASMAMLSGSVDCVKILDLDGRLLRLNAGGQNALELERIDQLDGQTWWALWPQPQAELAKDAFEAAKRGEVSVFSEACPTVLGTPRRWDVTVSPIRDALGEVERILVVSRDVTALSQARKAMETAGLRKDEILATVAHELRNPLAAAMSGVELLQRIDSNADKTKQIAAMLNRQLLHIARITEDLLDSARIARGDLSLVAGPVDLNVLVFTAVEQLRSSADKKRQALSVAPCKAACEVQADGTRLVQAIGNLIANAVRYTPEAGRIDIAVTTEDQWFSISVADSGIGIAPHRLASLFDRYSRLDPDSDRSTSGLGLGLSLVRSIVELHGGSVAAASTGLDSGSVFTIRLPVSQPAVGTTANAL